MKKEEKNIKVNVKWMCYKNQFYDLTTHKLNLNVIQLQSMMDYCKIIKFLMKKNVNKNITEKKLLLKRLFIAGQFKIKFLFNPP